MLAKQEPLSDYAMRLACPVALAAVLCLVHVGYMVLPCFRSASKRGIQTLFTCIGVVSTLFYISLITLVLTPLQCQPNPNGKWTSTEYASLVCFESQEHTTMVALGMLASPVPLGFIAFVVWAVRTFPVKVRLGDWKFVRILDFLFNRYRPQTHYFILVHVFRSLALALATVLPNATAVIVFIVMPSIACLYLTTAAMPYRGKSPNYLELLYISAVLLILCMAATFVPTEAGEGQSQREGAALVVMMVLAVTACAFPCYISHGMWVFLRNKRQKRFKFYVCHDQKAAGAFARLLVARMQRPGCRVDRTALAMGVEESFNRVREDTEVLVVLCSQDVILQSTIVGQMAIAFAVKVPIRILQLSPFWRPSESLLQGYTEVVDISDLVEWSITPNMIMNVLRHLADMQVIVQDVPVMLNDATLTDVVEVVCSSNWGGSKVSVVVGTGQSQLQQALEVIIFSDPSDREAQAAALIMQQLLEP
eukprot:928321-Amphidinium_carterae.1